MALNDHDRGAIRDPGRDPVLDRLYAESAREEPPARLDAAIRAAARRAVGARPRPLESIVRAWRVPVSVAAILVLSASLVLFMKEEGADRFDYAPPPAVLQPQPAEEAQTDALRPQMSAPPQEAPSRRAVTPAPPPTPPTGSGREQAAPIARNDLQRQTDAEPSRQPSPAPLAAPLEERRSAPSAIQVAPAPQLQDSAALSKDADSGPKARGRATDPPVTLAAPEPPAARPLPQADTAARKRAESELGAKAGSEQSLLTVPQEAAQPRSPAPSTPRFKPALRPGDTGAQSALRAPIWSGFEAQPAEKWIERIEDLRRTGREADAREMLEEFRKRFPEHPLPASLTQ